MSQREPSHHHRRVTEKARDMALEIIALFRTPGTVTLSLTLLEIPHRQRGGQNGHDQTLQGISGHDGPRKGGHHHRQHDATRTAPPWPTQYLQPYTTTNRSDHIHSTGM